MSIEVEPDQARCSTGIVMEKRNRFSSLVIGFETRYDLIVISNKRASRVKIRLELMGSE
jgi:hypothetical protein